ncbi:hypothetical protein H1C71_038585, partial [Ictidomys tridecemlineatus]
MAQLLTGQHFTDSRLPLSTSQMSLVDHTNFYSSRVGCRLLCFSSMSASCGHSHPGRARPQASVLAHPQPSREGTYRKVEAALGHVGCGWSGQGTLAVDFRNVF